MSIQSSLDLLNTTFPELSGPLTLSFLKSIPTVHAIMEASKAKWQGGVNIQRDLSGQATGTVTPIRSGNERLRTRFTDTVRKLQVEPCRFVLTLTIPNFYTMVNQGKPAILKLIDEYPRKDIMAFAQDLNKYLLTGTSTNIITEASDDLYSMVTLNGQFASGLGLGATNGVLQFLTPAAQTGTSVFALAKNQSYFHYNQFGQITSWATNGMKVMKATYRRAKKFGEEKKGPQYMVSDPDTFSNIDEFMDAKVRTTVVDKDRLYTTQGDKIPFMDGFVQEDQDLDRSDFSGVAAQGVTYGLDLNFWEWQWTGGDKELGIQYTPFADAGPLMDAVYAKAFCHGGMICRKLPAQFCVAGGAV